jgi:histidine ammonia-lyase
MGANSATKCYKVIENVETILAIELMNASQALYFREPLKSSPFVESFLKTYRSVVPYIEEDRVLAEDIQASLNYLRTMSVDSTILFE